MSGGDENRQEEPNFVIKRLEHSGYVYCADPHRYVVYVPPQSENEPTRYRQRLGMHCYEMTRSQYAAYGGTKRAIHVFVLQIPLRCIGYMPPLELYVHPMESITRESGASILRLRQKSIAETLNDERYNFVTFSLLSSVRVQ